MAWSPQSFQPETPLDKNAVINELYPQAIPSTDFVRNAGIMPQQQPWSPQTFTASSFEPETVQKTVVQENPSFIDRSIATLEMRGQQGLDALNSNDTMAEKGLQVLGKSGAGSVADIGMDALKSIYNSEAGQSNPFIRGNKFVTDQLADTAVGRGASNLASLASDQYGQFAEAAPRVARNLESAANILGVVPGINLAKPLKEGAGSALAEIGGAVEKSGVKSAANARTNFVQDLIREKSTPSVKEDLVGRTKEMGLLRRQEIIPTPQELEIADTVSSIKGVKQGNSLQGNANAIQEANRAEAESLLANLQKNDVAIDEATIASGLESIGAKLGENPYLSGADASKAANSVKNQAMKLIMEQPRTASGLLQARKNLDAWVKSQRPNAFDAADAPVTVAVREIRQGINDLVDNAVPDANVKASLRKQSNLYRAHENIATKAKDEAPSRLGRARQKIEKGVSMKQGIAGMGALAGLGITGLAAPAAAVAGPLGAGALAVYGLQKAARSPALRKVAGKVIRKTGEIIK